jgi:glycosyltransferase involved in cell wall biosynthesis
MRVGIYNEPSGTFGGSEYLVSVTADALAARHAVEIVHHNPGLSLDQLRELSGLALSGVTLRHVPRAKRPDSRVPSGVRYLAEHYRAERAWHESLSRPYDVFINSTHDVPPFCHAAKGILLTLFPAYNRVQVWPWTEQAREWRNTRMRSAGFEWIWHRRFRSYQKRFSISCYTQRWTKRWWHIQTKVLYPPVDTHFEPLPKSRVILSVGRFATYSHSKRHLEMMSTFKAMKPDALRGWCYYSVGGLIDDPRDRAYFDDVAELASHCGAAVIPNVARADLRHLYSRARLFWHAAGYGNGPGTSPFDAEHFGIATVEAMAAGAVPIVYDHGGQTEVVEHGRSGFLWKSLDELRDYTVRLTRDDELCDAMSAAARARAAVFSRERFVAAVDRMVA